MFSMKVVSQSTGLSADTLRAWERRHSVVRPVREPNGRRTYSADDLVRLGLLKKAVDHGHPIRNLARLDSAELSALVAEANAGTDQEASAQLCAGILSAIDGYDIAACHRSLAVAMATLPISRAIEQVLVPVLHEAGERWSRGVFSIAQERILSTAVRGVVTSLFQSLATPTANPMLAFTTLPGERHDLGVLLAGLTAVTTGFSAVYLGADLPVEDSARLVECSGAQVVAVGMVVAPSSLAALSELSELRRLIDARVAVWVGGAAAEELSSSLPAGVTFVRNFGEAVGRLEILRG
ncbi:MAG: DNA-binding transcriptional MerR regulator [Hyphomicrobiaceae bacterium]|jgi:DNA-binding transcriptional MerR regulator